MATSILITGASGLIGNRLTEMLLQKGHRVSHLSRTAKTGTVPAFTWDVKTGEVDHRALEGVGAIIHLAGAGVADKRWTDSWKREIHDSRTRSTALLHDVLKTRQHRVKTFVSGSAIGYYGYNLDDRELTEESVAGNDFLATVVKDWENEADRIASLGMRVVKIRTGIVLSPKGGALEEMARPVRWGVGSPLGSGKQWMSWIHIDDLCGLFIKAVEDGAMKGPYNATAPNPATNKDFTKAVARTLRRPMWLPNVPAFALRLLVGQVTEVIVNGGKVSSDKIKAAGFNFQFPELDGTLNELLTR